jgi:hypothetical protein
VSSVIDVNAGAASSVHEAFDSFFETLRNSEVPFRVAIVGNERSDLDPSVAGPYPYIDQTLSADESHAAVDAMLDGIGGDEDRGLALLEAALEEHRDWLIDDAAPWGSSTLHLAVVNIDTEQSPLSARDYIEQYSAYKGDAAGVAVSGVSGPPPHGCAGGGGADVAEPSERLFEATQITGGAFFSICDDWITTISGVGAVMAGMFPLSDPPLDATITVSVDGKTIDAGWVYDPQSNAIRFDDDSYPVEGSVVGIEYGLALACE